MEFKVKAAYLFNFAKFIEWPPASFKDDKDPVVFAVAGKDPFGPILDETLRGKSVGGHPVVIRRFPTVEDIGACHLLFVSASLKDEWKKVAQRIRGCPVVTVSEGEEFTRAGGMFRFFFDDGRVRFEVNLEAAKRAGLSVSARLIQVGVVLKDGEGK
jgi:hypothetical protein